ncbi:MAG: bifunctional homocysteine S-methyltransferase/methylenetetrahydrofolate reductase [bacterium]|jgi:5,10-methylenetetrahydrofolate reductase
MELSFLEAIKNRVLLADGAFGTEIYSRGFFVNRCYDELNLSATEVIQEIHNKYAQAGSEILRTNTFGANRLQLDAFGFGDKVEAINRKGVELARNAAGESAYVAGSIGPIPHDRLKDSQEAAQTFREQALILADAGVDLLFLESFHDAQQLELAFRTIRDAGISLPILPSISLISFDFPDTPSPVEMVKKIRDWGGSLFGLCDGDPVDTLDILAEVIKESGEDFKICVLPGSGLPQVVECRTLCLASPEYMAEYARRYVQKGAAIIGGSYGTAAPMIKEMGSFLRSVQPGKTLLIEFTQEEKTEEILDPIPIEERTPFGKVLGNKFGISVELDPPKGLDASKSVEGAKFLYENGIDAVNIADGPRATGRMAPTALALLVRREVPIETIIHVCCRDRNLLAIQMDLISANALGLRNLMLITGDPPKMGIYPDSTAVFDLDAIGLVSSANLLNHGLDFARRPLDGQTGFVLGVGCNPGAPDLEREIRRYEQKVKAGAEYVFSQPVYDPELLDRFLKGIRHVKPIPFFVGILPLASSKNAEFLHTQVPGMQIPDEIRKRMRMASTKEDQRVEGIKIASEALKEVKKYPQIKGAYIFPPFGRYERILDVLEMAEIR